jgi:ketosteroid isomerase-like protein
VTPQEIFERYTWGGMTRNADVQADLFAPDGVLETPLLPPGRALPPRMAGREEIRQGLAAYHQRTAGVEREVNLVDSRYVLHTTADPDVFIVEVDAVLEEAGQAVTISLVKIFRLRAGKIALLRDYFAPEFAE